MGKYAKFAEKRRRRSITITWGMNQNIGCMRKRFAVNAT